IGAPANGEEDQPRLAGIDEAKTDEPEKVPVAVETSAQVPSEAKAMGEVVQAPAQTEPAIASEASGHTDVAAAPPEPPPAVPDTFRFLNGQITNNLGKASATSTIQASILNAKGKLSGHVFISKDNGESFLLDADPELREELALRLDRYIIADDVQLENVTDKFSIFHFLSESPPTVVGSMRTLATNRFGSAGWDVWWAS